MPALCVIPALPSLPVLAHTQQPRMPAAPSPPALLRQALPAAAKIHSRALRTHPGLQGRLRAEGRFPAAMDARAPGAPSGQGRHRGRWARNHALHPGGVSAKDCCLSCRSTPATPTSGSKDYNSQQALRRLATPGMHCLTQSQAEANQDTQTPAACQATLLYSGRVPGLKTPANDGQEAEGALLSHFTLEIGPCRRLR